ncbi:glycosyltransferase family 2 protein [Streptomyces niveus]|uniref:glycosyltransferase family 2 protein n=1 Tax=Streptomyces niveus TaxID=193462 RepID=UPI0037A38C4B
MTRTISIITPVHAAGVTHLAATYQSLVNQRLPREWTWEWLVQEDGDGVDAEDHLPADHRLRVSKSRRGGPHVARTVALGRSSGELIKVLDADDLLTEGALIRDINVLMDRDDIGWTTSAVLDLLPNGAFESFPGNPPEGVLRRGAVLSHWQSARRPQVHPATLCVRRSLVMALGGWMALPSSGDTGLLLGLDALSPGWFIPQVGLHYRKHSEQITADARHSHGPEWEARMRVIGEHAEALHALVNMLSEPQPNHSLRRAK